MSSISQSNTGQISGSMQAVIGNNNRQMAQSQSSLALNQNDVIELLNELREIFEMSSIPNNLKDKANNRLKTAINELEESDSDKQLVLGNIKRVAKILEESSKTMDSGKSLLEKAKPIFQTLLGWFNVAKGFFGFC